MRKNKAMAVITGHTSSPIETDDMVAVFIVINSVAIYPGFRGMSSHARVRLLYLEFKLSVIVKVGQGSFLIFLHFFRTEKEVLVFVFCW